MHIDMSVYLYFAHGLYSCQAAFSYIDIMEFRLVIAPHSFYFVSEPVAINVGIDIDPTVHIFSRKRDIIVGFGFQFTVAIYPEHAQMVPVHVQLFNAG